MNAYIHGVIKAAVEAFSPQGPILEIGSRIIPGQEDDSIRAMFTGANYLGVDIEAGPGVDQIANVESLPFANASFNTVIALNVFEHTNKFWLGVDEVFRVLKPGGVVMFAVPFYFHIHNYPGDYWRVSPQAMLQLLDRCSVRIVGTQGSKTRPIHVYGIGFRDQRVTPEQWEQFQANLKTFAIEPIDFRTKWIFPLARVICGRRPFEPWIDLNRGTCEITYAEIEDGKKVA